MINNNYSVNNPILNKGNQAPVKQGAKSVQNSSEKLEQQNKANSDFSSELVKQQIDLSEQSNDLSQRNDQSENLENTDFKMILSTHNSDKDNLSYDQPTATERSAIATYQQVATHSQREQVLESMSFHFVV